MEIDALTKRALRVETRFMAVFTGMEGLEDPSKLSLAPSSTDDKVEHVQHLQTLLEDERARCKGLLEVVDKLKTETEQKEGDQERMRIHERHEWEQEIQKLQVKWTRRENELIRERDSALRRETEAKRERDNNNITDISFDTEGETLHDNFTREQESRIWELGAQIATLKEQAQRSAQEEKHRILEMEEIHTNALRKQMEDSEKTTSKLKEQCDLKVNQCVAHHKQEMEQIRSELLDSQKKIHQLQVSNQQQQHLIQSQQKQINTTEKTHKRETVISTPPPPPSSSSSSSSSQNPIVRTDWLSMLVRYRPARSLLLIYIPLVHIFLFLVLYSCSSSNKV